MNNTVILFCCHYWSPELEKEFSRLINSCGNDFDVVLSYDCSKDNHSPPSNSPNHLFTLDQIKKLGYVFLEHEGIWHHTEYQVIDYYLKNPHYDFYWRIEYDVRFGGEWGDFFRYFLGNNADLLGAYLRTHKDDPRWYFWDKINFKVEQDILRGISFPVVRFSSRALDCLDQEYKTGASGHVEVIVPTLLNKEHMVIEDIGNRFYNFFTFNFNSIVIRKKGKLHHPIKKRKFISIIRWYIYLLKTRRFLFHIKHSLF